MWEVHTLPRQEAAKVLFILFTDYENKQLLKIVRANMIKENKLTILEKNPELLRLLKNPQCWATPLI